VFAISLELAAAAAAANISTVVGHCLAAADVVLRPKISLETFSLKILQVDSDV